MTYVQLINFRFRTEILLQFMGSELRINEAPSAHLILIPPND